MAFKVNEHNGTWMVTRDSQHITFDGLEIDYLTYQDLKDKPHDAAKRYHRGPDGHITPKPQGGRPNGRTRK